VNKFFLIVAVLIFAHASRAAFAQTEVEATQEAMQNEPSAARSESESKLTPAEEQEARELAAQFVRRFRETDDIAPLVDEMFVNDFAASCFSRPSARRRAPVRRLRPSTS
jgi:hypothetical protein